MVATNTVEMLINILLIYLNATKGTDKVGVASKTETLWPKNDLSSPKYFQSLLSDPPWDLYSYHVVTTPLIRSLIRGCYLLFELCFNNTASIKRSACCHVHIWWPQYKHWLLDLQAERRCTQWQPCLREIPRRILQHQDGSKLITESQTSPWNLTGIWGLVTSSCHTTE